MAKFSKEVKQVFGFLGEDQDYSKMHQNLTFVHGTRITRKLAKV